MDIWEAMGELNKGMMKISSYPDAQHKHFERFQGEAVTVLEVGVWGGGSLQLWRTYFGPRAIVVGADINPACKAHEAEGIHVEIGDQGDPSFLAHLAERWGPFDIVIDDGGHRWDQQILTFDLLYPHVKTGGVYVCEDTLTSYLPSHAGGNRGTFMEYAKAKVDEQHAWFRDSQSHTTDFTRTAVSIHFYLGMVIVEKGAVEPPSLLGVGDHGIATVPVAEAFSKWFPGQSADER